MKVDLQRIALKEGDCCDRNSEDSFTIQRFLRQRKLIKTGRKWVDEEKWSHANKKEKCMEEKNISYKEVIFVWS